MILSKKTNVLNTQVIQSPDELTNEKSLDFLILCFCSNLLLENWKARYSHQNTIKSLIHKASWDEQIIRNEVFTSSDQYRVDFLLRDLLDFLHLTNPTENREKVLKRIKHLMDFKVHFQADSMKFYQPFMYSLTVDQKNKRPIRISVILHPFIVYDLINQASIFKTVYLQQSFNLLEKHKLNVNKRSFSFGDYGLISLVMGYSLCDSSYIRGLFSKMHKSKQDLRQRQAFFIYDAYQLAENYNQHSLCLQTEGLIDCPIPYVVLESLLKKKNHRILQKADFVFQPKSVLEIPEVDAE